MIYNSKKSTVKRLKVAFEDPQPGSPYQPGERFTMQNKARPLALIVEDEALLALAVEDLLTEEGFETLCAASEGQVLALLPAAGPIAVAVVDLRLGRDLAGQRIIRALREQMPNLPVVVVTGFGHGAPQADLRGLGWPTVRLPKPAGYNELAVAVRDVVDQARTGRRPIGKRRTSDQSAMPLDRRWWADLTIHKL
jgi:ActR/RegA family two-component response regulator